MITAHQQWSSIVAGSASAQSGIIVGDTITAVTTSTGTLNTTVSTESLHDAIITSTGPITVSYIHEGKPHVVTITPTGQGVARVIGIAVEPVSNERLPFFIALKAAVQQTWITMSEIFVTLASLIAGLFHHNGSATGLVGPVGLAQEIGSAASIGFTYLLAFTAAISVNLGGN